MSAHTFIADGLRHHWLRVVTLVKSRRSKHLSLTVGILALMELSGAVPDVQAVLVSGLAAETTV